MTTTENPKDNPARYPADRRHVIWVRPRIAAVVVLIALLPILAAWTQYIFYGLPAIPMPAHPNIGTPHTTAGFPVWLRITHYVNFLMLTLIARSGLSILMDHPRLYRKVGCSPGTEWIRFTPTFVPTDRLYTANDDQRYLSPLLGLPGYKHTVGMARHWHFLSASFWMATGLIYSVMLFASGHWTRLVPGSWHILPQAWDVFVYYGTFHKPPEPDGFFRYNALQQLAYFGVVFGMAPLSMLSGLAMSPAFDNRHQWYPRLFGGRQSARSLHFLLLAGYIGFTIVHVSLVVLTGFVRNMNHIVLGTDTTGLSGAVLGVIGIASVGGACVIAHWIAWHRPRDVQQLARRTSGALSTRLLDSAEPSAEYSDAEISPRHWPNGKLPTSDTWCDLARDGFREYRLEVSGLVENPLRLSLGDLADLEKRQQTTLHHCIQGWSGIAEWGGLPMAALMELVRPLPSATVVAFYSFGDSASGDRYYETLTVEDACHTQTILAYEMNYNPLSETYGAPLRLRVENQLGYKMVKWISAIEFVESEKCLGKGFGGTKEDEDFFDYCANI